MAGLCDSCMIREARSPHDLLCEACLESRSLRAELQARDLVLQTAREALRTARPLIEDEWRGMEGLFGAGKDAIERIDAALAALSDSGRRVAERARAAEAVCEAIWSFWDAASDSPTFCAAVVDAVEAWRSLAAATREAGETV